MKYGAILTCLLVIGGEPSAVRRPSLLKALREADLTIERAKLPSNAFGKDATESARKRRDEIVEGLRHSGLMSEPLAHSIAVTAINDAAGGAATVLGIWERDAKGKIFTTAAERDQMNVWDVKWTESETLYNKRVEAYNRHRLHDREHDHYCGHCDYHGGGDPALGRTLEIERFNVERDADLRPINEALAERVKQFAQVRFELNCPMELAAKLDRPRTLKRTLVPLVIQVESVELGLAGRDIPVPPVIALIRGTLIDVDTGSLKKSTEKAEPTKP